MPTVPMSTRTDEQTREKIAEESALRGHTLCEAINHMIKFGMPDYLKRFPKKYAKLDQDERAA